MTLRDELVESVLHSGKLQDAYQPMLEELAEKIDSNMVDEVRGCLVNAIAAVGDGLGHGCTSGLAKVGRALKPLADYTDDDALFEAFLFAIGGTMGPPQLTTDASLRQFWMWSARWAQYAYPVVRITTKQAATLSLCDASPDQLDEIVNPWRSFYIAVDPQFVSSAGGPSGLPVGIRGVAVTRYSAQVQFADEPETDSLVNGSWTFRVDFGTDILSGHHLWSSRRSTQQAYTHTEIEGVVQGCTPLAAREERVVRIVGRMALNLCLHMTGRANISRHRPSSKALRRRRNGGPVCEEYILGTPVTVDVRSAVKDFVENGSKSRGPLTVQSVVRGHQQRYHYKDGDVRWKLKEPYFKGPEDAPILVRPHVVD
jgi:hypothetical protein